MQKPKNAGGGGIEYRFNPKFEEPIDVREVPYPLISFKLIKNIIEAVNYLLVQSGNRSEGNHFPDDPQSHVVSCGIAWVKSH